MYLRWVPALVAVPAMAILMALVAGVPVAKLGEIVSSGAIKLAPFYVAVIFGALLGRVTIETGIARAIVDLAAEYGGERPFALALGFSAIVAVLFTSLSGLGGIIMVGSIVLPIMMTAGIPRTVAATLFLMSFALGFIFNIANWTFYTTYFGIERAQLIHYAVVLAVIDAVALVIYAIVAFRRERGYATWAVRAEPEARRGVPAIALITPLVPLVLYYVLKIEAAPAFLISALYGVLTTRPSLAVQRLVSSAIRGVEDVAAAIVLFMGIGMLLVATQQPQFAAALQPIVGGAWLRNPVAYVLLFGVASPLVLYRGPLNPFGVGIAIFTAMLAAHVLPPVVLVAAIMAVVQVQNVCDPTNTANVWIANFTGVPIDTITKRTLPFQVGVAIVATLAVVLAAPALFGERVFASLGAVARAGELWPGLYAPAEARNRVAVDDDGTPLGRVAADAVAQALSGSLMQTLRLREDPNAERLHEQEVRRLRAGLDVDVCVDRRRRSRRRSSPAGLRRMDRRRVARSRGRHAAAAARHGARTRPPRCGTFAALGAQRTGAQPFALRTRLAAAPGDKPTYFYSFFKTPDGNMRAYVRAGGPAYAAGVRSGEIVEKIDGLDWWQYGTFRTQQMAYDGKPHALELLVSGKPVEVSLAAPFVVESQEREPDR